MARRLRRALLVAPVGGDGRHDLRHAARLGLLLAACDGDDGADAGAELLASLEREAERARAAEEKAEALAAELAAAEAALKERWSAEARQVEMEQALAKMEGNWSDAEFGTKEWRTGRILAGIDEIQQELDDQIVLTQRLLLSIGRS